MILIKNEKTIILAFFLNFYKNKVILAIYY